MPGKKLVLCVEDEPDIGWLLEQTLQRLPVDVALVNTGLAALELMAERRPDLIVLDLMLPRMSGWDVLKELRDKEEWQELPVVILSVRSGQEDRQLGKELNVSAYITKPFLPKHLQEVVGELLDLDTQDG